MDTKRIEAAELSFAAGSDAEQAPALDAILDATARLPMTEAERAERERQILASAPENLSCETDSEGK